jgi:hypothetical protein
MKAEFNVDIEITKRTDIANGIISNIRWIGERNFAWLIRTDDYPKTMK